MGLTASTDNISVGWKAVSNAEGYQVYMDGPGLQKTGTVAADQNHAIYYDVARGIFMYRVRAVNVTGYSPWTPYQSGYFPR